MISFYKDTSFGLTSIPLGQQSIRQMVLRPPPRLHLAEGLPFFETPAVENQLDNMPQLTASTYQQVKVNFFPQRLPLPSKIENGNLAGHAAALKALGGEDKVFTVLYWAKH